MYNDYYNYPDNSNHYKSCNVALNAATGGAGPLPIITTAFANPITVVSVNINASRISDPSILLTFTGIINLPLGVSVTLNFELQRANEEGAVTNVGSTYTFSTLATILESEAFSFQFFDAHVNPGIYTYTVQLSTNSIIDITPGVTVTNATLSALAAESV